MHNPPRILIVDDNPANRDISVTRLGNHGYDLVQAADGEDAIEVAKAVLPDLILLDVMMPKLNGIEATKRLKSDTALPFTPIILVTAKTDIKDVVAGLEAGADEYLTKPVDQTSLVARVKSMLRVKELHDKVVIQAADLARWNKTLEQRVADQRVQIERADRLKRFLAPQVAELVLNEGNECLLDSHRRDITVVFGELRGFTAFAETAEPEEVMAVLREYHTNLGPIVHKYEGTVERFIGDGFLVLFNDPIACPDPSARAIRMAIEMRDYIAQSAGEGGKYGHDLGFGIGISNGYATLGPLGFEGRFEYSAIGTVVNLAARLCAEAKTGQILIDPKVYSAVEPLVEIEPAGELLLKGLSRPIKAFEICALRPA